MQKKIDYKWIVLLLVSIAYFLAQGTRLIYSAVLPQIKADFASSGVTDTQLGLISSTFTLIFGLAMPFAGLAADLFNRKRVLVIGSFLFAIGIFVSGFAAGLGMLFISYGILNAIGQSLMPPCNTSLISQYHDKTRGTAFSIYQTAIYAGIVFCSVVSGYLAQLGEGGWRWAFWIFGAIAILWAVVIMITLKDNPQSSKGETVGLKDVADALKAFLEKPSSLILMAGLGCYFFVTYAFKAWAPIFMIRAFPDMDTTQAVFHGVFWFYLGAFVGVTLGGRISDALKSRRPGIRFEVEFIGLALCIPFILMMAYSQSLIPMIAAILLFGFATGVYDSNIYAALFDVINPRYRAVGTGLFGCGGCIVGAFGPTVAGFLNEAFSPRVSMASLAIFAIVGALAILCARIFTFNKDKI
jgi:MFS family permease